MFIEMQVEHPLPVMHLQIDGSNKLVEINVKMGKVRRGWDNKLSGIDKIGKIGKICKLSINQATARAIHYLPSLVFPLDRGKS